MLVHGVTRQQKKKCKSHFSILISVLEYQSNILRVRYFLENKYNEQILDPLPQLYFAVVSKVPHVLSPPRTLGSGSGVQGGEGSCLGEEDSEGQARGYPSWSQDWSDSLG